MSNYRSLCQNGLDPKKKYLKFWIGYFSYKVAKGVKVGQLGPQV